MAELTDSEWEELATDLRTRVATYAPEWTEESDADPGVTIIELFAFLAESILDRADRIPERRHRLGAALDRLERVRAGRCPDQTLVRNRYAYGQLLSVDDLNREQEYNRSKHRRHNRLLHGFGVVNGLDVGVESGSPGDLIVAVTPGVAIDANGEELVLCERSLTEGRPMENEVSVVARLVERPTSPGASGEATRVEESAEIAVVATVPRGGLAIARLIRDGDSWHADPGFEPARVGR
jgi:hypothetical protein